MGISAPTKSSINHLKKYLWQNIIIFSSIQKNHLFLLKNEQRRNVYFKLFFLLNFQCLTYSAVMFRFTEKLLTTTTKVCESASDQRDDETNAIVPDLKSLHSNSMVIPLDEKISVKYSWRYRVLLS